MNEKQKKEPFKKPSDLLTDEEIRFALRSSGYPLEIRLLKAFSEGGMDPVIGFRVRQNDRESREIDLLASFSRHIPRAGGGIATVQLRLVIEAKSLEPGAAFVGLPWNRPTAHELRVYRTYMSGRPSYRVLPGVVDDPGAIAGPGGIAEAFDFLNDPPVCVQWALVRRTKAGSEQRVIAGHEDSFWQGIDGIVRASRSLSLEHSTTQRWPRGSLLMLHELPVLVVATPQLWLHDATASSDESDLVPA